MWASGEQVCPRLYGPSSPRNKKRHCTVAAILMRHVSLPGKKQGQGIMYYDAEGKASYDGQWEEDVKVSTPPTTLTLTPTLRCPNCNVGFPLTLAGFCRTAAW